MQKFTRLIILLLLILIGMYFFLPNKPYLSRSKIHGDGLFAGKSYQKGEIIFEDLFPPPSITILRCITFESTQRGKE